MVKVLVVDDSALMRRQLMLLLQDAGGFEVRQARNGEEAVIENREFQPDVVTLDINMPVMDGLTALSLIMAERPVAVVMVSSLTAQGALATFEALNLGAVDYVAKPGGTISLTLDKVAAILVDKVRQAARARVHGKTSTSTIVGRRMQIERKKTVTPATSLAPPAKGLSDVEADGLLVIGSSTGGPRALEIVLKALPASFPWPVVVAQHMPAAFTKPFADRLDQCCALHVTEASGAQALERGTVYIGRGGADTMLTSRAGRRSIMAAPESPNFLWHPSVDRLGRSVLEHFDAKKVIAVLLTGMGHDGSDAFTEIKKRGGRTIAESEASCVVYGMPAELVNKGGASLVLHVDRIAAQVSAWAGR